MTFQFEIWQLVTLLMVFFSGVWLFASTLFVQVDRRLDQRFQAQEEARIEATRRWDTRFAEIGEGQRSERANWQRIEREMLQIRADLPLQYVRREDYVRNQSVIEAKLDALYSKIELVLVQGAKQT